MYWLVNLKSRFSSKLWPSANRINRKIKLIVRKHIFRFIGKFWKFTKKCILKINLKRYQLNGLKRKIEFVRMHGVHFCIYTNRSFKIGENSMKTKKNCEKIDSSQDFPYSMIFSSQLQLSWGKWKSCLSSRYIRDTWKIRNNVHLNRFDISNI